MNALRADQVGSLLRPSGLLQARVDFCAGRLDREGLRAEEDRAILTALRHQQECGIDIYTDGEFRRVSFMTGFVDAVDGFMKVEAAALPWKGGTGPSPSTRKAHVVARKLRQRERIADVEEAFLRAHAPGPFKITLPSPLQFAMYSYRPDLTNQAYASRVELIADAARILAGEARQLAADGVAYVQVDAPSYTLG